MHLLRPLLEIEGFPTLLVEEVVWNHAQEGLFLLDEHYRTKYTCRYQPVLQMFEVLHLVDAVAKYFPGGAEGSGKDGLEAVQIGLEVLVESRAGFPVAGPLQEMLRRSASSYSVPLPPNHKDIMILPTRHHSYRLDDLIDACTRPTYVQPISEVIIRFNSSFSTDWASQVASFGFREPAAGYRRPRHPSAEVRGAQSLMQIRNLLNTS